MFEALLARSIQARRGQITHIDGYERRNSDWRREMAGGYRATVDPSLREERRDGREAGLEKLVPLDGGDAVADMVDLSYVTGETSRLQLRQQRRDETSHSMLQVVPKLVLSQ